MKKLKRLLKRLFWLSLLVVVSIVVFNTSIYHSRQISVESITPYAIPEAVMQRLSDVVQITTVSYPGRIDTSAFRTFASYLDSQYVLVDSFLEKEVINDFSLVYKWPGKNPRLEPILLIGHIDVVPVERESWSQWTHPPYSGEISDGHVWGRGTLDDKVSILGVLEAFELLLAEGYQPERTVYLACGHDEEVGGQQGAKAIARQFEQRKLNFAFVLDEGMIVLNDALPGLPKPVALIGTAEKGYTTLELSVQMSDGGHSSMPPSETTIGILSRAVHNLETHPFPAEISGPTKELFRYTGPEMTLPMKAVFANLWLTEGLIRRQLSTNPTTNAVLRTTIAPTIIEGGLKENVLPTSARATVNFRIAPGQTVNSVIEYVNEVVDDERVSVQVKPGAFASEPSKISATDAFGFKALEQTAREIFPEAIVAPSLVIVATDSRHYESVAQQVYRFMPVRIDKADTKRIHGIDERISFENYRSMIRFYRQLILNSCK